MRRRLALRTRVTLAALVLGATLSALFALGVWLVAERMENRFVEATLTENLDLLVAEHRRDPGAPLPYSRALRGYAVPVGELGSGPGFLRDLAPGLHETRLEGRDYEVAVRDVGGVRYALVFDDSAIETLEIRLGLALAAGAVVFTYLSVWVGYWASGRVIDPVVRLAARIGALHGPDAARLGDDWGDDEVGRLARAFERYAARLGEYMARERAFTADASHELRNPIMVAASSVELLLAREDLDGAARRQLLRLERAVRRMGELVDVFLALAREREPEAGGETAPAPPIDLGEIAGSVIERHAEAAAGRSVRLALVRRGEARFHGRAAAASVVLENLVVNALRHARARTVTVEVGPDGFAVSDDGRGLAPGERARVFERGYRGSGAEGPGAGLGLSIVQRVCEHEGWTIELESAPGGGARLAVRLTPESAGDAGAAREPRAADAAAPVGPAPAGPGA